MDALVGGEREQIEITGDDELGARGERARENVVIVGIARDAWYVDGLDEFDRFEVVGSGSMEIVRVGSALEYRHYLGEVAILTKAGALNDPNPRLRFLHRDRLGSVVTITDEAGEAEARGYDPFGKPRDPDWADKSLPVLGSALTDRGFTDHEHLDDSQLIHVNGRGYDTFHRNLDAKIAGWVRANPNATRAQFESYLRGAYQRPDVLEWFPNGL